MKKISFSLLLIGTFAAYALYFQQSASNSGNVPLALDTKNAVTAVVDSAAIPSIPSSADATATSSLTDQVVPTPAPTSTSSVTSSPVVDQSQLQAQGKVRIGSDYASPITLVKTTRILSSDGKLYHLAQTVTVPARSHVIADVYADQNGSQYAIGPSSFSIPGLSSTLQQYVSVSSDAAFTMSTPITVVADANQPAPTPAPASTPTPKPTPAPVQAPPPPPVVKPKGQYVDGTYTGDSVDAFYGNVVISNGKISNVVFLDHPQDRGRSIAINNYAMPQLIAQAIQTQNANVNGVSGASATSQGFQQSLASALVKAKS